MSEKRGSADWHGDEHRRRADADQEARSRRRHANADPEARSRFETRNKQPLGHHFTHSQKQDGGTEDSGLQATPDYSAIESNPHILQVLKNPGAGHESRVDIPFTRIMDESYPTREYRRRKDEAKTVIHWGQRKLLMSEIEFLSMYSRSGDIVLYAGAAPGTHTPYLVELFPAVSFILVDPAPFTPKLIPSERLELRTGCFTDEMAKEFIGIGERLIFICDVRSCDPSIMSNEEVEQHVNEDMEAQMRWHTIMRPRRSMLKFRLSWKPGSTTYLKGDIYLPIWGPVTTTEARLVTRENSCETQAYDNTKYEQQMFYFNTIARVGRYSHNIPTTRTVGEGIDFCYDCAAEISVLKGYFKSASEKKAQGLSADSEESIQESSPLEIAAFSRAVSARLGASRTLLSRNSDPEERLKFIRNKQWVKGAPAYAPEYRPQELLEYSAPAQKMMARMGSVPERGLGISLSGKLEPLSASLQSNQRREGLGYVVETSRILQKAREELRAVSNESSDVPAPCEHSRETGSQGEIDSQIHTPEEVAPPVKRPRLDSHQISSEGCDQPDVRLGVVMETTPGSPYTLVVPESKPCKHLSPPRSPVQRYGSHHRTEDELARSHKGLASSALEAVLGMKKLEDCDSPPQVDKSRR